MKGSRDLLLGQIALRNRYITEADLKDALALQSAQRAQGVSQGLGQLLLESGKIDDRQLQRLVTAQAYVEERSEAKRLGELAVINGFATAQQIDAAIEAQKSAYRGGLGIIRPIGEFLVEAGVLGREDVESLIVLQRRCRRHHTSAGRSSDSALMKVEGATGPILPPSPAQQLAPPPKPTIQAPGRRWIRRLAAVGALLLLAALATVGYRELTKRWIESDKEALIAKFRAAEESGRKMLAEHKGEDAIRVLTEERKLLLEVLAHAERYGWDAGEMRAEEKDIARKLDALRQSSDWLTQIRSAAQLAQGAWTSKGRKDADSAIGRALGLVDGYLRSSTMDDPFRPEAEAHRASLQTRMQQLQAESTVLESKAKIEESFSAAESSYHALEGRASRRIEPSALQDARLLCEAFLSDAGADSRRSQVLGWIARIDAWEVQQGQDTANAKRVGEREERFRSVKNACDRARSADEDDRQAIVDQAVRLLWVYLDTAAADDPHLPSAHTLLKEMEGLAKGAQQAQAPSPAPAPAPAPAKREEVDIQRDVVPAVVYVKVRVGDGPNEFAWGSGFVVEGGYIVTNRHVVEGARTITVGWEDSVADAEVAVELVAFSKRQDLALLKLPSREHRCLHVAKDDVALGQKVTVVGFPVVGDIKGHPDLSANTGAISSPSRTLGEYTGLIETDAVVTPGNSGGPMVDSATGEVVGVVVAKATGDFEGRRFAIRASAIREEFPDLRSEGYRRRIPSPPPGESEEQLRTCARCKGEGLKCLTCFGEGDTQVSCVACGGVGILWHDGRREDCKDCIRGWQYPICKECKGDGKVRCPQCGKEGSNRLLHRRR